jgi:hypothetical protein
MIQEFDLANRLQAQRRWHGRARLCWGCWGCWGRGGSQGWGARSVAHPPLPPPPLPKQGGQRVRAVVRGERPDPGGGPGGACQRGRRGGAHRDGRGRRPAAARSRGRPGPAWTTGGRGAGKAGASKAGAAGGGRGRGRGQAARGGDVRHAEPAVRQPRCGGLSRVAGTSPFPSPHPHASPHRRLLWMLCWAWDRLCCGGCGGPGRAHKRAGCAPICLAWPQTTWACCPPRGCAWSRAP